MPPSSPRTKEPLAPPLWRWRRGPKASPTRSKPERPQQRRQRQESIPTSRHLRMALGSSGLPLQACYSPPKLKFPRICNGRHGRPARSRRDYRHGLAMPGCRLSPTGRSNGRPRAPFVITHGPRSPGVGRGGRLPLGSFKGGRSAVMSTNTWPDTRIETSRGYRGWVGCFS
jgi:hypothetical protein